MSPALDGTALDHLVRDRILGLEDSRPGLPTEAGAMTRLHPQFVNSFGAATISVLGTVTREDPVRGAATARFLGRTETQVTVVIGVTGAARGHVTFGMSLTTATKIASMIVGTPIVTFDATASGAIGEMAQVVCAGAFVSLSAAGFQCDLTSPTIVRGTKVEISTLGIPAIVVPFVLNCGEFTLAVGLWPGVASPLLPAKAA